MMRGHRPLVFSLVGRKAAIWKEKPPWVRETVLGGGGGENGGGGSGSGGRQEEEDVSSPSSYRLPGWARV